MKFINPNQDVLEAMAGGVIYRFPHGEAVEVENEDHAKVLSKPYSYAVTNGLLSLEEYERRKKKEVVLEVEPKVEPKPEAKAPRKIRTPKEGK